MKTPSDVFIYVSPKGKDWNPGTQALPVQSFGRALALMPLGYYERCRIIIAPGIYTEAEPLSIYLPNPVGPNAIDFAIVGEMKSVLGDLTCTAPDTSGTNVTYNTSPVPPGDRRGATLYCVSGANKESSRTVTGNTTTAFTINKPWDFAPAAGDVFQIQEPATIIHHSGINFWGPGPMVALKYLKFHANTPTANFGAAFLVKFAVESVEMDLGGAQFVLQHYCGIIPGPDPLSLLPAVLRSMTPFSTTRQADWYIHGGVLSLIDRCQISNNTNLVTKALSITLADSCTLAPRSIFGKNTDISLTTFSTFNHGGNPGHRSSLSHSNGANPYLIKADKNSIVGGGNAGLQRITLDNSGGDAILLQGNSHGFIGDVSGAGGPGVGINCTHMSTARVNQGGGITAVTGLAGATSIDGTITPFVSLPFTAGNTLCRIEF